MFVHHFKEDNMKYKDWLHLWLNDYVKTSCKHRTYALYEDTIEQRILPYLSEFELQELTPQILQKFVTELLTTRSRPLSTSTVNQVITVVQSSLKMAYNMGYLEEYRADKICRPKLYEKKVDCLTVLEQKKLETYILHKNKYKLYGIVICMYTGLRLGELLALTWDNVDMKECKISITCTCYYLNNKRIVDTPKTQTSVRTIPFPRQILPLFKTLKKHSGGSALVIQSKGKPISNRSYQRSFELVLNHINVARKGFHSLRHTFATRALECGMDVKTLSELLGHKNPTVTLNRYAHSMLEYKIQMMNKLGKLFA